ncbi:hypothetical protein K435DRAFT_973506, partial [Dendrothele bispora CBS 962.96]
MRIPSESESTIQIPAVLKFTTIRTFRSQTGQRALAVVKADILKSERVRERVVWVQEQLATRNSNKGAFHGPLLLETSALFLSKISSSDPEDDYPYLAGALALSAAAILWALEAWQTGKNTIQDTIGKCYKDPERPWQYKGDGLLPQTRLLVTNRSCISLPFLHVLMFQNELLRPK